jgi:enoyl-CoA hydratase/carnithine racemase
VANAHVVVAAHGSSFGMTEVRIGMWPFTMYSAVEAALGPRRMVELALTSKIFNTPEALAWGLIHEVVPPYELEERGEALGQQLANGPTETIARGLKFSEGSHAGGTRAPGRAVSQPRIRGRTQSIPRQAAAAVAVAPRIKTRPRAAFGRLAHENAKPFRGAFASAEKVYKQLLASEGHRH